VVGAVVLVLILLTGIVLWWPGLRVWRVNVRANWKRRINFDLHSAIGSERLR
jgi:uncharacterized iron-regulated membrane protein